ncbi:hypothetical protein SAMN03080598_02536 [Algoriphagus boritolerans DSM 17298 = JCM 18970]|uniref:Uncharacterized protein n=1 Tax=Algoriphagus boritolerans DSM 17298 = JCM 18970 TaxID=1120964 RepID=A0A1H5XJY0_9BACT|nr:hypothetical protein SAMN03080598_02536 [Algoriphagus boritolerans DSM 17298 = JCM 18970]
MCVRLSNNDSVRLSGVETGLRLRSVLQEFLHNPTNEITQFVKKFYSSH